LANVSKQLDIGRSMFPPQAAAMAEEQTSATGHALGIPADSRRP